MARYACHACYGPVPTKLTLGCTPSPWAVLLPGCMSDLPEIRKTTVRRIVRIYRRIAGARAYNRFQSRLDLQLPGKRGAPLARRFRTRTRLRSLQPGTRRGRTSNNTSLDLGSVKNKRGLVRSPWSVYAYCTASAARLPTRVASAVVRNSLAMAWTSLVMSAFPMAVSQLAGSELGSSLASSVLVLVNYLLRGDWGLGSGLGLGLGPGRTQQRNQRLRRVHGNRYSAQFKGSIAARLIRAYFSLNKAQRRMHTLARPPGGRARACRSPLPMRRHRLWFMSRPRHLPNHAHDLDPAPSPWSRRRPVLSSFLPSDRALLFSRRRKLTVRFKW